MMIDPICVTNERDVIICAPRFDLLRINHRVGWHTVAAGLGVCACVWFMKGYEVHS
jgi:hypothetical protein